MHRIQCKFLIFKLLLNFDLQYARITLGSSANLCWKFWREKNNFPFHGMHALTTNIKRSFSCFLLLFYLCYSTTGSFFLFTWRSFSRPPVLINFELNPWALNFLKSLSHLQMKGIILPWCWLNTGCSDSRCLYFSG